MYVSVSCFSELLDTILTIMNLTKAGTVLDAGTLKTLEEKALDFVLFATESHKNIPAGILAAG